MIIKGIVEEDFVNYKKPSMFIIFPTCSFKCDKENGCSMCQNSFLAHEQNIIYPVPWVIVKYLDNPITKAIVCGGLEPMDSPIHLLELIKGLRKRTEDDIVIYTGYTEEEMEQKDFYKDLC